MPVLKADMAKVTQVGPGLSRRFVHTKNLMMVVIDFTNGPWSEPEPLQSHVHEQVTYVAEGEIFFFVRESKKSGYRQEICSSSRPIKSTASNCLRRMQSSSTVSPRFVRTFCKNSLAGGSPDISYIDVSKGYEN